MRSVPRYSFVAPAGAATTRIAAAMMPGRVKP